MEDMDKNVDLIGQEYDPFFGEMFARDAAESGEENPDSTKSLPRFAEPKDLRWEELSKDIDKSKFGEYTVNPETIEIDWAKISPEKIKQLEVQGRQGSPFYRVAQTFIEMNSAKYHFPGAEFARYFAQHPDAFPELLGGSSYWHLLGSVVRDEKGNWCTLYFTNDRVEDGPQCAPLNIEWRENAFIVLEK